MLRKLRELLKGNRIKHKKDSGQIAIILILIIAVSLIFFAVSMNFGKISLAKTRVTIASNAGASQLVSQMASYGQYLFESMLGGKPKICGPTGFLMIIIAVISIVAFYLSVYFLGMFGITVPAAWTSGSVFYISILSVLSVYMLPQVIIDQIIARKWNQKMSNGMTQVDMFIEQAIQTGLARAVDDPVQVADLYDMDEDTLFGYTGTDDDDTISRFAIYVDHRISKASLEGLETIQDFLDGLKEFVYDDPFGKATDGDSSTTPDHWGLYDPVECAHGCCYDHATNTPPGVPSVCNPCCVPNEFADITSDQGAMISLRPETCDCVANGTCLDHPEDEIGISTTCAENSFYPDLDTPSETYEGYRYDYNPFFENHENEFLSFLERLGVDDESAGMYGFFADKEDPSGLNPDVQYPGRPFGQIRVGSSAETSLSFPQSGAYTDKTDYRIQDASGYFKHQDYALFQACRSQCNQHPEYCYLESETGTNLPSGHGPLPVEPSSVYNFGAATFSATGENCAFWRNNYITPIMNKLRSGSNYIDFDTRVGVFPFFYKIADWGLDLSKSTDAFENGTFNDTENYEWCGWYDSRYTNPSMAVGLNPPCSPSAQILPEQLRLQPLMLPLDPYSSSVKFNITPYVDGENKDINGNIIPLKVDKVKVPDSQPLIADEDSCAENKLLQTPKVGFWKKGGGYYCALQDDGPASSGDVPSHWPYNYDCAKHGQDAFGHFTCQDPEASDGDPVAVPCQCVDYGGSFPSSTSASDFPEDDLDAIVHGLPSFLDWAERLLARSDKYNKQTFRQWYAEAADWIEPGTAAAPEGHGATQDSNVDYPCFVCNEEDGGLWKFYEWIKEIRARLVAFRTATFSGTTCDEVWCGTSNSNCYATQRGDPDLIWPDEAATMGTVRMNNVISCLDHNVSTGGGNAERFRACSNSCKQLNQAIQNIIPDGDDILPNPADVTAALTWAHRASSDCVSLYPSVAGGNFLPRSLVFDSTGRRFNPTGDMFEVQDDVLNTFIPCETDCYNHIHSFEVNAEECVHDGHTLPYAYPGCGSAPTDPLTTNPNDWSMGAAGTGSGVANTSCFELWNRLTVTGPVPASLPAALTPYPYTSSCATEFAPARCLADCSSFANPQDQQDCSNCFGLVDQIYGECSTYCAELYTPTPMSCDATKEYRIDTLGNRVFSTENISVDCLDPLFVQKVSQALAEGMGSCNLSIPGTGIYQDGFVQLLDDSIPEAENQVEKFRRRSVFLKMIRHDLNNVISIFTEARDNFAEFLECATNNPNHTDSPVCALTKFMIDNPDTGLPFQAVYGWQGETPTDRPPPDATTPANEPYVHIVKVEARMPLRCDDRCSPDQVSGPQKWPYVKSYTEDWGTMRCYKIARKNGTVKFRVTRYDEPKESQQITFPNGMPLWNFKQTNPDREFSALPADAVQPYHLFDSGICTGEALQIAPPPGVPFDLYGGAFLMDQRVFSIAPSEDNHRCWDRAHYLLSQGVSTETCAQYFWGSDEDGFLFKFVPCKPF